MRNKTIYTVLSLLMLALNLMSCRRSSGEVWDDTKSAGRHVSRGVKTLGGKHGDSRQIKSREEFARNSTKNEEFVPLNDEHGEPLLQLAEGTAAQPNDTPGESGSMLPGIESFQDPTEDSELAEVFKNIYFDYNSHMVTGNNNLRTIQSISDFMKKHPNVYIFIEGHCDERGPAAYNLALGSRRSNTVRNLLINEGVNLNNIFTISYGKERPLSLGNHDVNRRAQFKVYQR